MLLSLILALPLSNDHITLLKYQGALGPHRHTLDLDTCALREAAIARAVPASVGHQGSPGRPHLRESEPATADKAICAVYAVYLGG